MVNVIEQWLATAFWSKHQRSMASAALVLVTLSLGSMAYKGLEASTTSITYQKKSADQLPNILILSADGLNSTHMSAYGYTRINTPFLMNFRDDTLVSENSFTNAANTGGSIGALLTGKLPTRTRVIFPPDIFTGEDVYQHLPGILRILGYKSIDISIRHYADAFDLNMIGAFDVANGRRATAGIMGFIRNNPKFYKYSTEAYFFSQTVERISNRLQHAFNITDMDDPHGLVTQLKRWRGSDPARVKEVMQAIMETPDPFFIHLHLMDTHGPRFAVRKPLYSKGKKQKQEWMNDFYDDAIMDYDSDIKTLVQYFKKAEIYERMLIVLTSDHGKKRSTHDRVPLMIKFPYDKHKGRIKWNTQRIDIAPTILDYLDIEKPEWMQGSSLISVEQNRFRHIYSSHTRSPKQIEGGWFIVDNPLPPYYSLGAMSLVICNKWYNLNLEDGKLSSRYIEGHTDSCDDNKLPTESEAKEMLDKHLEENSYDVSVLQKR